MKALASECGCRYAAATTARWSSAGEGLIAAAYRHRMSRALDPQLHTHVVAANLTRGPDGRYTALHGAPLYRAAKTAGYLYESHLRGLVSERTGLRWGSVRKGAAELVDVPQAVLEEFSKRRREMLLESRNGGIGLESKAAAEKAAIATRDRKRYGVDTHSWREEVRARAAELGMGKVAQERAAARAEPPRPKRRQALEAVRDELERLRAQRGSLPLRVTERLSDVDARVAELERKRERVAIALADLPQSVTQRHTRSRDQAVERAALGATLSACDDALASARAERARLQHELGDREQLRSERDGLDRAIRELRGRADELQWNLPERGRSRQATQRTLEVARPAAHDLNHGC
jgi:hypothetical protein